MGTRTTRRYRNHARNRLQCLGIGEFIAECVEVRYDLQRVRSMLADAPLQFAQELPPWWLSLPLPPLIHDRNSLGLFYV